MKIVKWVVVCILILLVIFAVAGLIIPKNYTISESVTINKPRTEIYNYVKYLKNQDKYSKWGELDPNMQQTFSGTDATVGFTVSWKGNADVGEGLETITNMEENTEIDYKVQFIKPFESTLNSAMQLADAPNNATKVTWSMRGYNKYPMNTVFYFMQGSVKSDLKYGLDKLKKIMENN